MERRVPTFALSPNRGSACGEGVIQSVSEASSANCSSTTSAAWILSILNNLGLRSFTWAKQTLPTFASQMIQEEFRHALKQLDMRRRIADAVSPAGINRDFRVLIRLDQFFRQFHRVAEMHVVVAGARGNQ